MRKEMIMPVIHKVSEAQVLENVRVCARNGIFHVWLIDHSLSSWQNLDDTLKNVRRKFPEMWVGVNYLQLTSHAAAKLVREGLTSPSGLWCDNGHLEKAGEDTTAMAIRDLMLGTGVSYFGGVEFKYQRKPKEGEIEWVHKRASELMDVLTTSGPGTGQEINLDKLKRMRDNVGDCNIAVASGVSHRNKNEIFKYADYAMVASSITTPGTEMIIEDELKRLIEA